MREEPRTEERLGTFIDNRESNRMLDALLRLLPETANADIATGYFQPGAFLMLKDEWKSLSKIRLLMGDEHQRTTRELFARALSQPDDNGIEAAKEEDDWKSLDGLAALSAAITAGQIHARVYTRTKFHAKSYYLHGRGQTDYAFVGSSNFTRPGLTQNLELNLLTKDASQIEKLKEWYEQAWKEAEDVRPDLLKIIEPHIREYMPFEIYLQAMREMFLAAELKDESWETRESRLYPILAQYQRDAYHDLIHMADTWGGGLLCDGVGLGKTFVALMLIERALKDRQRVLVVAPKAAIPSVWNRNLLRYFPDEFDAHPDYQHDLRVIPMTDFGRDGTITDERLEKLRNRYDVIIVDEAHHFRVPSRNRSMRMKTLTKGKRVFLLTATPVNNTLLDLYFLINYIAQDRRAHFQSVNVPNLRQWFGRHLNETGGQQLMFEEFQSPDFHAFLKHILVQRSRAYVKQLDSQLDKTVKFPTRAKPVVIEYSLTKVYGELLPNLFAAFNKRNAKLRLVIYETEKFKEESQRDTQALQEQSNVVGLVRTMLLKRLESSQKALEASLEDLLLKHVVLLEELEPILFQAWMAEHKALVERLEQHRRERLGRSEPGTEDEEDNSLPLTNYEAKKIAQVKEDIQSFGQNRAEWLKWLESDATVLANLLSELHEVTKPEHDAKLHALLECIEQSNRLKEQKFVLFSEFKDTARYLELELKKRYPKDSIVEVDSGRNVQNREWIIQQFAPYYNCEDNNSLQKALGDPIRVLISTDVLSEGLNLQDANIIINYDLHWNPVRLMQRIGRVDRRMDPTKPIDYDEVYVYNFLPPEELDDVLKLYQTITSKLIAINRAIGIEAPVLDADDDFKAMDFYLNLGEGKLSDLEQLRLIAHELEQTHPEIWNRSLEFPNRIYSGKSDAGDQPPRYLFLCYRVAAGYDPSEPEVKPTQEVKWVLVDTHTETLIEDPAAIHSVIRTHEGTARVTLMERAERTRWRNRVENEILDKIRYRSQTPAKYSDELICWMEVG